MSSTPRHQAHSCAIGHRYRLAVNAFDRIASLLVALLMLVGAVVAGLTVMFLFRTFSPASNDTAVYISPAVSQVPSAVAEKVELAKLEETPDDLPLQLQDTLKQLSDAISTRTALLSTESLERVADSTQGTQNSALSYHCVAAEAYMPVHELRFDPMSDADYARMIDYFDGELAVLDRRNNKIYYAKHLTKSSPTIREGTPAAENKQARYRLLSAGTLQQIEVRMARKAGIMRPDAIILVFYSEQAADEFLAKEQAHLRKNGYDRLEDVARTVFQVTRVGQNFEITIEHQTYL